MCLSLTAVSGHEVPKKIDGAEDISAEGLFDEVLKHPDLVIVDARDYEKVYWLRGGFNEWKAKGFPYLSK